MDTRSTHTLFHRDPIIKPRWIKEWIPQDLVSAGGKCFVLKWVNEVKLKAMKEKSKDPEMMDPEPEPTAEVLFLCSYEGCGKTFIDAGTLRKHSQIHGERQYVCHYENCGKKFMDSSKLKRHFLSHTGERQFVCPHEGCGKAFSLPFNLRSHMKTHSQENYHICPYPECGKRYAHECKLKKHVASHHGKNVVDTAKYAPPPTERPARTPKPSSRPSGPAFSDRPYVCPYDGCTKAYIHEYKLNIHLRREHPGHFPDETKITQPNTENEGSDRDAYAGKRVNGNKIHKWELPKPELKLPPSKTPKRKGSAAADLIVVKKDCAYKEERYDEEDSEETEEEGDNLMRDRWRTGKNNNEDDEDDDEETEYED